MFDRRHDLSPGDGVGAELVGDHHTWRLALLFQQLAHQPLGRLGISAALHQNVQHKAALVDGPPEPLLLAGNGDDHFVEVPFVTQAAGGSSLEFIGKMPSELLRPRSDRLMGDDDAAGREHILDHA